MNDYTFLPLTLAQMSQPGSGNVSCAMNQCSRFLNVKSPPGPFLQKEYYTFGQGYHKIISRIRCKMNKIRLIFPEPVMHLSSTHCRVCDKFILEKRLIGRKQFIRQIILKNKKECYLSDLINSIPLEDMVC